MAKIKFAGSSVTYLTLLGILLTLGLSGTDARSMQKRWIQNTGFGGEERLYRSPQQGQTFPKFPGDEEDELLQQLGEQQGQGQSEQEQGRSDQQFTAGGTGGGEDWESAAGSEKDRVQEGQDLGGGLGGWVEPGPDKEKVVEGEYSTGYAEPEIETSTSYVVPSYDNNGQSQQSQSEEEDKENEIDVTSIPRKDYGYGYVVPQAQEPTKEERLPWYKKAHHFLKKKYHYIKDKLGRWVRDYNLR